MILKKFPDLVLDFVHPPGNSSGVVDGAAALLVTSPDYAKAHGLTPRARVLAPANMGDAPTLMLHAPAPAAPQVLPPPRPPPPAHDPFAATPPSPPDAEKPTPP